MPTVTPNSNAPILVAAGDIVCGPNTPPNPCEYWATSDTVLAIGPDVVIPLGDLQYENGLYQYFLDYYDPSWGRFKEITRPVPGNHEYYSSGGAHGYFDYFNGVGVNDGPAGERGKGYYSFDLGNWHIIAINSNCPAVSGCDVGSPQEVWLRQDLAASTRPCTLAYWHHARFSSGGHLSDPVTADIWQALYDYDAEVVLSGHDHDYERFLPQDAQGNLDMNQGIVQFVVGTGGKNLTGVHHMQPNSAVFSYSSFGVLKMTLQSNSYQWEFVPSVGTFTESGSAACH
jgi:acid phosphatase type 7